MNGTRVEVEELDTAHGPARIHLRRPADDVRGLMVLGPGASGSIRAADLELAVRIAGESGLVAALVEPPYVVAGRRVPPRGSAPDESFVTVVEHLSARFPGALITGGRSYGSRVACRTAAVLVPTGVLCLAFPEHPPGKPERSRQPELDPVTVPVLVVQGASDPFGCPSETASARVLVVPGDHSLKKGLPEAADAIRNWLTARLG
ncbi:alpha/beta family hydrolase [Nakamurella sp. A5-74]|uniref:Alpha/beta family hydrolase n=1 Tax=Nakamurella sp. A5-74 TaxID=3158264 RepID=A0AAU8DPN6_9ACTN